MKRLTIPVGDNFTEGKRPEQAIRDNLKESGFGL
jgi:hypothetical protein